MPIYAYRCDACGLTKDVLQKVSDAELTECPSCGQVAFKKQITAAGFQLKGTGWYVTDFRNNGKSSSPSSSESSTPSSSPSAGSTTTTSSSS